MKHFLLTAKKLRDIFDFFFEIRKMSPTSCNIISFEYWLWNQGISCYRTRWNMTSSKSRRVIPCLREQSFLFLIFFFVSQNCASWVCLPRRNAVGDTRYFRFSRPSRLHVGRIWSRIIREKASIDGGHALFCSIDRFRKISWCKILAQSSAIKQFEYMTLLYYYISCIIIFYILIGSKKCHVSVIHKKK